MSPPGNGNCNCKTSLFVYIFVGQMMTFGGSKHVAIL